MCRLTLLFLIVGTIVVVSAYPPGYVPQRCQDDDGTLLPSATDCEDESDLCPTLFGNITTDVRAKACNSEIDVVKEGVMMCAKTCKVCCEKPKPPTPEPVTPHPYPLRCQDENGNLLPSATDCEDESDLCPALFGNITTDVRANICNGEIDAVKEGVMMCAKTCKVCCEKPEPPTESTASESTTTDPWGNTGDPPLRCQNPNGTLLPSATDCEDESPTCSEVFFEPDPTLVRSDICNDKVNANLALSCARKCKICCERPNYVTVDPTTEPSTPEPPTTELTTTVYWNSGNREPLRCQDENRRLLPSATDCEDELPECKSIYQNLSPIWGGYVRSAFCNDKKFSPDGDLRCAKTCKVCCERENATLPALDFTPPERDPYSDLRKALYFNAVDIKPHCQYENGTLMESATNCDDRIPDACEYLFMIDRGHERSPNCYKKQLRYFAYVWCPKTCGLCCESRNHLER